jgi:hypothetical protein
MFRPVFWQHEPARDEHGNVVLVHVVLWDYEAKVGQARTVSDGQLVHVYVTDYSLGDLTIGVRHIERSLPYEH